MKKILLLVALICTLSAGAQDIFYYYEGQRVPLQKKANDMVLKVKNSSETESFIKSLCLWA